MYLRTTTNGAHKLYRLNAKLGHYSVAKTWSCFIVPAKTEGDLQPTVQKSLAHDIETQGGT